MILHVDSGRSLRGGQYQALLLAEGLEAHGWNPTLLVPARAPLYELARERGVPVASLNAYSLWRMARQARLVHVHDARSHTLAAVCGARPLVVSRRVAFPVGRGLLSRWKYSRAALYTAVSQVVADELTASGVDPARVTIVPDGVALAPLSSRTGPVVAPASSDPRKGSALAARSAVRAGLRLESASDIPAALQNASMFLYLTDSEGLGSGILLAMAAGVPVVASRVGGIPEIVRHEETGLLVNNDEADVSAALLRLASDAHLAARLAANGRRMVEDGYTIEHMVQRTMACYRQVLA